MSRSGSRKAKIDSVLDDFESHISRPPSRCLSILKPPDTNPNFEALRQRFSRRQILAREDEAAVVIQKTFRMYRIHRAFQSFYRKYRACFSKSYSPFFYNLELNSYSLNIDRKRILGKIDRNLLWGLSLSHGSYHLSYEAFQITGLISAPSFVDEAKLVKFVKLASRPSLRNIILEWRLAARKEVFKRTKVLPHDFDKMSTITFKLPYIVFEMWLNLTRIHKGRPPQTLIPQWKNYEDLIAEKKRKLQAAVHQWEKVLKSNAVNALHGLALENKRGKEMNTIASSFARKACMKNAMKHWLIYSSNQKNKTTTLNIFFRKWERTVHVDHHIVNLLKTFKFRHEYFQKRSIISILIKNAKAKQIVRVSAYIRLMRKPSLGYFFLSCIIGDTFSSFFLSMYAWISYIRRRDYWLRFLFKELNTSEYEPLKKKSLNALKGKDSLQSAVPVLSEQFRNDTLSLYQNVMIGKDKKLCIFTNERKTEIDGSITSKIRKALFSEWKSAKLEGFAFQRASLINFVKRSIQTPSETERVKRTYKFAVAFLASLNLATEERLKNSISIIESNNRKSYSNRKRCILRDSLVILSDASHKDAKELSQIEPKFKAMDPFELQQNIKLLTVELSSSFQPLTPLLENSRGVEKNFAVLRGCKAPIPPFNQNLKKIHAAITSDLERIEVGADIQKLNHLISSKEQSQSKIRNFKTNSRIEVFSVKNWKNEQQQRPQTGMNDRLSSLFKTYNRTPKIIEGEFIQQKIEERKAEVKEDVPVKIEKDKSNSSITLEISKSSSFFHSMETFSNLLTKSSIALFSKLPTPSQSKEMLISESIDENEERPKKVVEISERSEEEEEAIEIGSVDGFTGSILEEGCAEMSIPNTNKKYTLFIQLLFGKALKDANGPLASIKKKLIAEYRSRKPSSQGIITRDATLPITNVVDKFRTDHEDSIEVAQIIKEKSSKKKIEEKTEYECTYNSRRYPKFDKYGTSAPLSERSDLEMPDEERHFDEEKPEEHKGEEINDNEIDAAENGSKEPKNQLGTISILTPQKQQHGPMDQTALNTVNNVVLKILDNLVKVEKEEENLVDYEPEGPPGLNLGNIVSQYPKTRHHFWNPPQSTMPFKPHQFPKRVSTAKPKRTIPIVIPDRPERTEVISKIISESEKFGKLVFDDGKATQFKAVKPPSPQPIIRPKAPPPPPIPKTEEKVVSFAGGGRSSGTEKMNFASVRISNIKQYEKLHKSKGNISLPILIEGEGEAERKSYKSYQGLKVVIDSLIRIILKESPSFRAFQVFRKRAKYLRKEKEPMIYMSKKTPMFYASLQKIYVKQLAEKCTEDTVNDLLRLMAMNPLFVPNLTRTIDKVYWEYEKKDAEKQRRKRSEEEARNANFAGNFVDISWMSVIPRYKAVAVQYKKDVQELNALIASTDFQDEKSENGKEKRSDNSRMSHSWDEFLGQCDLNDLVLITKQMVPENLVNSVIKCFD